MYIRVFICVYTACMCVCICVFFSFLPLCMVCRMLLSVYDTFTIITIRCSSLTIHLNPRICICLYLYIYMYNPKKNLAGYWTTTNTHRLSLSLTHLFSPFLVQSSSRISQSIQMHRSDLMWTITIIDMCVRMYVCVYDNARNLRSTGWI